MKTFSEKSRESYNKKANDYDNTFDGKFTMKFKRLLLENITIKENYSILDVACGNGTFLKMLSNKYDINGYGIDISEKMIENAKAKCPNMDFFIGTVKEETAFGDNYIVRKDYKISELTMQEGETVDAQWVTLGKLDEMVKTGAIALPVAERLARIRKDFENHLFRL